MLDADLIRQLFHELNDALKKMGVIGEIGICGGAVMALVYNARQATKDVDGIFKPTKEIRAACTMVADKHGIPHDWLNDAAKAFFGVDPPRQEVMNFSNLRVWAPTGEYMLAMKCVSARFDTSDRDDVSFLIKHLGLKTPKQVF